MNLAPASSLHHTLDGRFRYILTFYGMVAKLRKECMDLLTPQWLDGCCAGVEVLLSYDDKEPISESKLIKNYSMNEADEAKG